MIGVFGADMAEMQVHLTSMLVVSIILITAQVRPFDGSKSFLLHALEMASLMATFLTLWAGSIFNTLPKCEDPLKGEGFTLPWCDALSIIVGLIDIGMFITFIVCFLYLKATAKNGENSSNGNGATGVERNCCVQKVADCIYALERQRVLRMTPEEQQLRARSRTVDARNSVTAIKNKSYWNFNNLSAKDPVALNLFSQKDLKEAIEKAERRIKREKKIKEKLKQSQ